MSAAMSSGGYVELSDVHDPRRIGCSDVAGLLKAYIDAKVAYEVRQQAWLKLSFTWAGDRSDLEAAEMALREAGVNV